MQAKGLPQEIVLKELKARLKRDFTYGSGRIMGSMCTSPHPLARRVFFNYIDRNIGDPGLFPAVAELEREVVRMLGALLSNAEASGHIVTGGTEANILALWAAKKLSKRSRCEVVVPSSAHRSFDKAAELLRLRIVKVRLNDKFQVDVEAVKRAVNRNTVAIVGVAGTTDLGVVDPIPELSEIAADRHLYLHVDAAFGGFVLPFLKELGYDVPEFDFLLPGVCSITVDPHKMGLAPIPAGGILFRNENLRKVISLNVPYLAGGEAEHSTLVGTRSGASIIAVWALLKHLGREGYKKVVKRCMRLTLKLAEEIPRIKGLNVVTKPTMNVIGLKSDSLNVREVAQRLRAKGWAISLFENHIRIVVMPHIRDRHIERFLDDLRDIVNELGD